MSGAYVIIPGINKVFVIITNSGTMIYCLAYTLMALGFISMRRKSPDTEHPFRVGKKGNGLGFFFAGLLMVTIVFALDSWLTDVQKEMSKDTTKSTVK